MDIYGLQIIVDAIQTTLQVLGQHFVITFIAAAMKIKDFIIKDYFLYKKVSKELVRKGFDGQTDNLADKLNFFYVFLCLNV